MRVQLIVQGDSSLVDEIISRCRQFDICTYRIGQFDSSVSSCPWSIECDANSRIDFILLEYSDSLQVLVL